MGIGGVTRGRGMGIGGAGRARGRGSSVFGPCTYDQYILQGDWEEKEPEAAVYRFKGAVPGPSPVDDSTSAVDLFCRFFTDEVWDLLVAETNRYAARCRQQNTHPRGRPWTDVTVVDMKAFVGILFHMGICKLPELQMYWSQAYSLLAQPISELMSFNRFQQILRFLHLNDTDEQVSYDQPGYDALFKVRKLLDLITPTLMSEYHVHEELAVDEAMIPFKGRLSFKQYMKDKPTKWGIKVFVLADSRNGYVKRIQIYTGKNSDLSKSEIGLASTVVLELLKGLEQTHPKVYMDNFYISPVLFVKLWTKGVNACGTVRANRKHYPADLLVQKVDRGYYDYRSIGPLLACVWMDKRIIHFLTTLHAATLDASVKRRTKDGTQEDVRCPPCLPDYQAHMRGVDRGDQLMSYYNVGRRSRKWWKRVFAYLIEVACLNAYVLKTHGQTGQRKSPTYLEFRLDITVGYAADVQVGRHTSKDWTNLFSTCLHMVVHWSVLCVIKYGK